MENDFPRSIHLSYNPVMLRYHIVPKGKMSDQSLESAVEMIIDKRVNQVIESRIVELKQLQEQTEERQLTLNRKIMKYKKQKVLITLI